MKAEQVKVYSGSQVVVNQINGNYEIREPQLKNYLTHIHELAHHFSDLGIQHIPRFKNKRADALSKLASSSFSHLNKKGTCRNIALLQYRCTTSRYN